jgi:hypothetical protein
MRFTSEVRRDEIFHGMGRVLKRTRVGRRRRFGMGSSMVSAFVQNRKGGVEILLGREVTTRSPRMLRAHAHGLFSWSS